MSGECQHERTVQVLGVVFKCSNCGEVFRDESASPPDWEQIERRQRARRARIERAKIRDRG